MTPVIAVFGASASTPGDSHYEDGIACGRLLAEAGYGVVTGGYGGLMEAVSRGAAESGGRVVGVTAPPVFPGRHAANDFVAEEIQAEGLLERMSHLIGMSSGAITLHGSIGTMAELTVAWNQAFITARHAGRPKPIVAVGPRWGEIIGLLGNSLETDGGLVSLVPDVESAVAEIRSRVPF